MRPGGDAMRRSTDSEVTLLPQPDSPTTARVSPGATAKDTPSTARTMPSRVKKWVFRPSISSSGTGLGINVILDSHVAGETGVERIAQPVAQQIDRQYREREE